MKKLLDWIPILGIVFWWKSHERDEDYWYNHEDVLGLFMIWQALTILLVIISLMNLLK